MTVGLGTAIAVLLSALVAHPMQAQDAAAGEWSLIPHFGFASRSPVGAEWGIAADRNHAMLGVQLETSLLRIGHARILFAPNVTPLMRLWHTPGAASTEPRQPPALGVGIAPFGLALQLPVARGVHVFGGGAVGGLWFNAPVPVPNARAFNVTIEWGGGLDLRLASDHVIRLGYKFHHLSNVYTAPENPGVDAHVFYAGWRFQLTAPR